MQLQKQMKIIQDKIDFANQNLGNCNTQIPEYQDKIRTYNKNANLKNHYERLLEEALSHQKKNQTIQNENLALKSDLELQMNRIKAKFEQLQ